MDHCERLEIDVARFDLVTESLHVLVALLFGSLAFVAEPRPVALGFAVAALLATMLTAYRLFTRRAVELRVVVTPTALSTGAPGALRTVAFRDFMRVRLTVGSEEPAVELVTADGSGVRLDLSQLGHEDLERLAAYLFRTCPLPITDSVRPERNRAGRRSSLSA